MAEPPEEVSIAALDAHGHGLAANGAIVPGALPGERSLVKLDGARAELVETLDPSPERAQPVCPWFGTKVSGSLAKPLDGAGFAAALTGATSVAGEGN